MNPEPMNTPSYHPQTIIIGKAVVPYGPRNVGWSTMNCWHTPGCGITTDRAEAIRVCKAMAELMEGA